MAQGVLSGMLAGTLVSVAGLGGLSLLSEQPPGSEPPAPPQVEAPQVEPAPEETAAVDEEGTRSPVGSIEIDAPQAPDLPEGEAPSSEPAPPAEVTATTAVPRADTDPLDAPEVVAVEGAMEAPETDDGASGGTALTDQSEDPVLPNPQAPAPQPPRVEADVTVSTAPAAPLIVAEPDLPEAEEAEPGPTEAETEAEASNGDAQEEFIVVDLGESAPEAPQPPEAPVVSDAGSDVAEDPTLAEDETPQAPRLQLQGGENSLLADRNTGVTIRRPGTDAPTEGEALADAGGQEAAAPAGPPNALAEFAAQVEQLDGRPLMSIVLIDDGAMPAAAAALAGLPFPVTIALDPGRAGVAEIMAGYRADGFEVGALARLPEGAVPTDVEVTFESVFRSLPQAIAVVDLGASGLQDDREVTAQAMNILNAQGRGFITVAQGLNMAERAAEQAGVPSAVIYRDLDSEGQDARVIRRFVDQAAFRARQESGVVLVGRVRPDTISALILWGTANSDDQVQLVPLSALLQAQE